MKLSNLHIFMLISKNKIKTLNAKVLHYLKICFDTTKWSDKIFNTWLNSGHIGLLNKDKNFIT